MSKSVPKVTMYVALVRLTKNEELVAKFLKKEDAIWFIADRARLSDDNYTSRIFEVEVDQDE